MDLRKHYQEYKTQIETTALEGSKEYAKTVPTAFPETYPTLYDFLMFASQSMRQAVEDSNAKMYCTWASQHQHGLIQLYEKMVEETLPPNPDKEVVQMLINERGWKWFKFCKHVLKIKMTHRVLGNIELDWIPRYKGRETGVCFDADELSMVCGADPERAMNAIATKQLHGTVKWCATNSGHNRFLKPAEVNCEKVRDWALPLFVVVKT